MNRLPHPGPLLSLDPGEKRVGVAVSDPTQMVARPLCTLKRGKKLKELLELIKEEIGSTGAVGLLMGLPLLESGDKGKQAQRAETLAFHLRKVIPGTPLLLRDERWTSDNAREAMQHATSTDREKGLDAAAAAVLLQGYLDEWSDGCACNPGDDLGV